MKQPIRLNVIHVSHNSKNQVNQTIGKASIMARKKKYNCQWYITPREWGDAAPGKDSKKKSELK
jgi:hypothetical protein